MSVSIGPRVKAEFPEAFEPLFQPARYKIFHGGRGAAKSWAFARALLIRGTQKPLRIICAREFQNSIDESVHQLLADQVADLGLSAFYEVKATEIVGLNGTSFAFYGLRRNINSM